MEDHKQRWLQNTKTGVCVPWNENLALRDDMKEVTYESIAQKKKIKKPQDKKEKFDRIDMIVKAIAKMNPEKDYNNTAPWGPKHAVLTKIVGFTITPAERAAAYKIYKENQESATTD